MTGLFSTVDLWATLTRLLKEPAAARYCVAFSGGVDSTALLYGLALIRREHPSLQLRAVHVNHHLLPGADQWAQHCRAVAMALQVPLDVLDASVVTGAGISTEAAARDARYSVLQAGLAEGELLLTAHHQEDQLETVLLQLFRGAGVAGLAAMAAAMPFGRGVHLRPLLDVSREALRSFVSAAGLTWIEDTSNADERYDRNHLRHRLLPLVLDRWPAAAANATRSAAHLAEAQALLDQLARVDFEAAKDGDDALSVEGLRSLDEPRARNLLRYWIRTAGFRPPSTAKLHDMLKQMLESRLDAKPRIAWGEAQISRRRGRIYLQRLSKGGV